MRIPLVLPFLAILASPALAAERNFPVQTFEQIELAGSSEVTVTAGPRIAVTALGDPDDLDRLDIRVVGDRLVIGTKRGSGSWGFRKKPQINVTVPNLSAATISGSGNMKLGSVTGPFSGRISGSGTLGIQSVEATALKLAVSGSGDIRVTGGRCDAGNYGISGSGGIAAGAVRCRSLEVSVTGSGNVDGQASETADLRVTGSGNVSVTGGARCTTRTTGSGTTRCQ